MPFDDPAEVLNLNPKPEAEGVILFYDSSSEGPAANACSQVINKWWGCRKRDKVVVRSKSGERSSRLTTADGFGMTTRSRSATGSVFLKLGNFRKIVQIQAEIKSLRRKTIEKTAKYYYY